MDHLIAKINRGEHLLSSEAEQAVGAMMSGTANESQMEAFLLGLREKGVCVDELVGASQAMRQHMTPIRTKAAKVIDTCGTGGAGTGTFNISTTAAIIAAGAGATVAKHGNRKVSSKSGSADVLSELGVNIDADHTTIESCLDEAGICFCFAQKLHPSMKNVGPVRQRLAVPTIFNLLGPLCNPAGASFQVLGVGRPEIRELIAKALCQLGTKRAVVVHGDDGLCEVSNAGPTSVTLIEDNTTSDISWEPSDFGLTPSERGPLLVDSPAESATMIRRILDGEPGPARDISAMNAATALWVSGSADSLEVAVKFAFDAIDSGRAKEVLARLAEVSHR